MKNVSVETIENQQVVLTVEVEAEELAKAEESACKRIAGRVNIPGFRKGKAPRKILERNVGKDYVMQEAFELIYPKAFSEALKQQDLVPVTRPEVEVVTLESEKDVVFKVTFTKRPEVTLGEYKNLNIEKNVEAVTDEDIDEAMKETIRQNVTLYMEQIKDLSSYQMNFLRAICQGIHSGFTAKDILDRFTLGAKSNINRLHTSLVEKELIESHEGKLYIMDPVFEVWFKGNFSSNH